MPTETVKKEKDLSPESLLQTFVDTTHSKVKKQTEAGLEAGVDIGTLAASLVDTISKSNIRIGTGEKEGLISGLFRGHGFSRPEATEPLSIENLSKLLTIQKAMQDVQAQTPGGKAEAVQTKEQEAAATARGGALGKQEQASKELSDSLNIYYSIADKQKLGDGVERFTVGIDNVVESIDQSTPSGLATSQIEKLNKWLRVKLVRRAGDVGNLNIVEQLAAEQLLFDKFDSKKMRGLKKVFLDSLIQGVNNNDSKEIQSTINKLMDSEIYEPVTPEFKSEQDVLKAKLPKGTKIVINGRPAIWE